MFECFTDRARKVMQLANQEAQRLKHEYIGTEHIGFGGRLRELALLDRTQMCPPRICAITATAFAS
jgi:Clp amino terminal domain, pathogenicity island component